MFLTITIAVVVGFLLILVMKKTPPPTPRDQLAAGLGDGPERFLDALTVERFQWLCNRLFQELGLEPERSMRAGSRGVEMVMVNPTPIIGGQLLVHGQLLRDGEVIDAVQVLALLDAVKGEGASKGVLITNGFFSDEATTAAAGAPIELINGARFQELLQRFALVPTQPVMRTED